MNSRLHEFEVNLEELSSESDPAGGRHTRVVVLPRGLQRFAKVMPWMILSRGEKRMENTYLASLSGRQGGEAGRREATAAARTHLLERDVDALVLAPDTK